MSKERIAWSACAVMLATSIFLGLRLDDASKSGKEVIRVYTVRGVLTNGQ